MNYYLHYARLLDEEAKKKMILADLSSEPVIRNAHMESMLALWVGAELLRREAKREWHSCQKSERAKRLSLLPLSQGCRSSTGDT